MSHSEIVATHNGMGWTSVVPNQITCEWLDYIRESQEHPLRVLDIGAGFGVATIPALKGGARVIANDIETSHLDAIRKEASDLGYEDHLESVVGRFPGDLAFTGLDSIHCSNVPSFPPWRGDRCRSHTHAFVAEKRRQGLHSGRHDLRRTH